MNDIRRAAEILRRGGLVAFPTETVYGLGADASSREAMACLYRVKRRPADHPVIVHFADSEHAFAWAREVPESARTLAERFWPGPLTLILKRADHVGDFVTGGQDTVGVRVPAHSLAHELLVEFAGEEGVRRFSGVAAPSANRFGRVSPTTAQHVRDDLGEDVDFVLDGGPCGVGIESTIVDVSRGAPAVLRPGGISVADLESALGMKLSVPDAGAPRVSGSLETHYAPNTPARLVRSAALDEEITRYGSRAAVLAFAAPDPRVDNWLRMPGAPEAYARRLYAALRELDQSGCQVILIEAPPNAPEWGAVLDRLQRAARS
ncbi:MAG: threonylcarbamoyl-AMP synthase [Betaproteobacteria bacterium]|nr:threonylcarbamoyl-AMP synthase [Betaproteobacteria bacterium]